MDVKESGINEIRLLSDLHFDYKRGYEDLFFEYISENFKEELLILAGDFYNSFKQTLKFVKKLESMKVQGFLFWEIMIIGAKVHILITKLLIL